METVHGLVVTTVCRTVDEFVERYRDRASARKLFVGVIEPRALGGECAFAFFLADRQMVLAGVCEVLDIYVDARNEYGRPGMRLAIRSMGPDSEVVWSKLVARREQPDDGDVDAAIDSVMTNPGAISSNDLSAHAFEFEEQTTIPLQRPVM